MRGAYGAGAAGLLVVRVFVCCYYRIVLVLLPDDAPGKRTREAREKSGYSQRGASRRLRCSPQWLGQVERGERTISLAWAAKMADLYGVTVDWVATGKGTAPVDRVVGKIAPLERNR